MVAVYGSQTSACPASDPVTMSPGSPLLPGPKLEAMSLVAPAFRDAYSLAVAAFQTSTYPCLTVAAR